MQKPIITTLLSLIACIICISCGGVYYEEETIEQTLEDLKLEAGVYDTTLTRIYEGCGLVPEEETGEWDIGFENGVYSVNVKTMDLQSEDGIIFTGKKISNWCTFLAIAFVNSTEDGFVGFVRISINGLCGSCYDTAGIIGEKSE